MNFTTTEVPEMADAWLYTGSRSGMSAAQMLCLGRLLRPTVCGGLIHGDCVRSDENAHRIAVGKGVRIVQIHPSDLPGKRAFCTGAVYVAPARPPKIRNVTMARACGRAVAAPGRDRWYPRSGTWHTVGQVLGLGKPVLVIWRDGSTDLVTLAGLLAARRSPDGLPPGGNWRLR